MINREQVRRDLRSGLLTVEEIASRAGCSVRTVYRIAAGAGPGGVAAPDGWPFQVKKPQTEAEAKKALSALISEFENYYKTEE